MFRGLPPVGLFLSVSLCGAGVVAAAEASRPNVLIVLTDDQGYGDLGGLSGEGKALPVAAIRVEVAGQSHHVSTNPSAKEIALRVELPRGQTKLHAWFQDADGNDLSGAFYTYVHRLGD